MIETELKLTTGEQVKGYYLDEGDKKTFYENRGLILGFKNRLEFLENMTGILRRMVKDKDIISYFKKKIMEELPKRKSFHRTDITYKINSSGFGFLVYSSFDELVSEGIIEYRGSGWYRKKEKVKN